MRKSALDFQNRLIAVSETRTRGQTEIVKAPKTAASRRTMPMMEAVAHYLTLIMEQQSEAREFLGDTYADSDYLVVDEFGKPISLGRLHKLFKKVLADNGMRPIRFHDIRHP